MSCNCTTWKKGRYATGRTFWARACGPVTSNASRRAVCTIAPTDSPGWYRPVVTARNQNGFISSTVSGAPVFGLAAAKRVGGEMLADECRSRGF